MGLLFNLRQNQMISAAAGPDEPLRERWSLRTDSLVDLAVSDQARRCVTVTLSGHARAYGENGEHRWSHASPYADQVALSRDGELAVIYAAGSIHSSSLIAFDGEGVEVLRRDMGQPILGVVITEPDRQIAVLLRDRILLLRRTGDKWDAIPVRTPEPVAHLTAGAAGSLYAGLAAQPVICRIDAGGRIAWSRRLSEPVAGLAAAGSVPRLVVSSEQSEQIRLQVFDLNGTRIYNKIVTGVRPVARLADSGRALYLSYRLKSGEESAAQQRLAYLQIGDDSRLSTGWFKGGLFTTLVPLAMNEGASRLIAFDVDRSSRRARYRLFDETGQRVWTHHCRSHPLLARSAPDGTALGLYRNDGRLEILEISERTGALPEGGTGGGTKTIP